MGVEDAADQEDITFGDLPPEVGTCWHVLHQYPYIRIIGTMRCWMVGCQGFTSVGRVFKKRRAGKPASKSALPQSANPFAVLQEDDVDEVGPSRRRVDVVVASLTRPTTDMLRLGQDRAEVGRPLPLLPHTNQPMISRKPQVNPWHSYFQICALPVMPYEGTAARVMHLPHP